VRIQISWTATMKLWITSNCNWIRKSIQLDRSSFNERSLSSQLCSLPWRNKVLPRSPESFIDVHIMWRSKVHRMHRLARMWVNISCCSFSRPNGRARNTILFMIVNFTNAYLFRLSLSLLYQTYNKDKPLPKKLILHKINDYRKLQESIVKIYLYGCLQLRIGIRCWHDFTFFWTPSSWFISTPFTSSCSPPGCKMIKR